MMKFAARGTTPAAFPSFDTSAAAIAENGYDVLPIHRCRKNPIPMDWRNFRFDEPSLTEYRGAGIGILTRRTPVIDMDVRNELCAAEVAAVIEAEIGPAPMRIGQAPKAAWVCQLEGPAFAHVETRGYRFSDDKPEDKLHAVEILADGQQSVCYNIHPDTQRPYVWNGHGEPLTVPIGLLPALTVERARALVAKLEPILGKYGKPAGKLAQADNDRPHESNEQQKAADPEQLREALSHIKNADLDYSDWIRIGFALKGALGEHGREDFAAWSAQSAKNEPDQTLVKWQSFKPTRIGAATIYYLAGLAGWKRRAKQQEGAGLPLALLWFATLNAAVTQRQLVRGLLLAGSLFVVYGESNSGKTFWVLDLALNVAAGFDWRGRRVERGLVLYIAGEGSASVRNRVAAIRQQRTDISPGIPFAILPQAVNFMDRSSVDSLIATTRDAESESGENVSLIIVDTLNRAMFGADENSSEAMGTVIAEADRIRTETGAAVGFVHHTGKDVAKGARGHSSLRAAVDTEILIEGQSGTRTATVTKQRDLPSGESFGFELKSVVIGEEEDQAITSCVVAHAEGVTAVSVRGPRGQRQRDILRMIEAEYKAGNRIIPSGEIIRIARQRLGVAKQSAYDAVTALATAGFIKATVGGMALSEVPT